MKIYIIRHEDRTMDLTFFSPLTKTGLDNSVKLIKDLEKSLEEVTRYSGFNRNPEDPDSKPLNPTWEVNEFKADLRRLFGKFKGELKNPEFIKGVAEIMVNWKALLRSQLDEAQNPLLKQNKLSSSEYQKAKKLKGFNKDNYKWNADEDLYIKSIDEAEFKGKAIITFKNDYEVKMNTGEGYDDDFEYFEAGEREQVYILDKNGKRIHVEFGDGTNAFIPSDIISVQEKSLNEYQGDGTNKISDDKLMRLIPKMPKGYVGKNTGIGKYTISTPDGKDIVLTQSKDKKNWSYEPSNAALKILNEEQLDEKKKEKKDPPLNKPKRGGSKAYYVYVRDPKTKKIKKVSFGSGGLRAKIKNKEARNAFAARHNCKNKKDRTKAGYWSCNLPRYASALGLGANMNTFW